MKTKALFKPIHNLLDGQVIEKFYANVTIVRDVETWAYEINENRVELKKVGETCSCIINNEASYSLSMEEFQANKLFGFN